MRRRGELLGSLPEAEAMVFFKKHEHLGEPPPADRRAAKRRELTCVCTVSFDDDQGPKHALLIDLSVRGARFGTAVDSRDISLDTGKTVTFNISSPYGTASWQGRVVWVNHSDTTSLWGVEFTRVLNSEQEPVRHLLTVG